MRLYRTAFSPSGGIAVEADPHAALMMLGDVAASHPQARVDDAEQDVHGLAGAFDSTERRCSSSVPARVVVRTRVPARVVVGRECTG
jgi:hypothetical protein